MRRERSGRGREKWRGVRLPWGGVGRGDATSTFQKGHPCRGGGLGDQSVRPPSPRVSLGTLAPCPPACARRPVPARAGEAPPAPAPPRAPRPPRPPRPSRPCLRRRGSSAPRAGEGLREAAGGRPFRRERRVPSEPAAAPPRAVRLPSALRPRPTLLLAEETLWGSSPLQTSSGRPSRLVQHPAPGPVGWIGAGGFITRTQGWRPARK